MGENTWRREHGEGRVKEKVFVWEKENVVEIWRETPLNTSIIKTEVKGGDGSTAE